MVKVNPWEEELNAIRVKLYEDTKDLTVEERVERTNENGRKLAAEFGFTIGTPARKTEPQTDKAVCAGA
jgi:hypothetical protein